jgi:hypothetical protein
MSKSTSKKPSEMTREEWLETLTDSQRQAIKITDQMNKEAMSWHVVEPLNEYATTNKAQLWYWDLPTEGELRVVALIDEDGSHGADLVYSHPQMSDIVAHYEHLRDAQKDFKSIVGLATA